MRLGKFDVLIGINLLREGLDIPEVSLVVILDADKEGFLRNERSLVQTIGRAARNERGTVIMYADKMTDSMRISIDETNRRRRIQQEYNLKNNITPKTITRTREAILGQTKVADSLKGKKKFYVEPEERSIAADPVVKYLDLDKLDTLIKDTRKKMEEAAKDLDFVEAARFRDELFELEEIRKNKEEK